MMLGMLGMLLMLGMLGMRGLLLPLLGKRMAPISHHLE